jgi:hypothetical protein
MANIILESLVRRGISVLLGGVVTGLRSGTGYAGMQQTPPIGHAMQHPRPKPYLPAQANTEQLRQATSPVAAVGLEQAVSDRGSDAGAAGAGRSPGQAGVSVLSSPPPCRPASIPVGKRCLSQRFTQQRSECQEWPVPTWSRKRTATLRQLSLARA